MGHYLYTGSALGTGAVALEGRLTRHKRTGKKKKWHVDYLTSRQEFRFSAGIYLVSAEKLECKINASIQRNLNVESIIPHLGSSDCDCTAHLFRLASRWSVVELFAKLDEVYSTFGTSQFFY